MTVIIPGSEIFICTESIAVQPPNSEILTLYNVEIPGLATGLGIVLLESPVEGLQLYEYPPVHDN